MVRLTPDAFLDQFTRMLNTSTTKNTGTVDVSFKRYAIAGEANLPPSNNKTGTETPKPAAAAAAAKPAAVKGSKKGSQKGKKPAAAPVDHTLGEAGCLVRAVLGPKKISCVVPAGEAASFQKYYNSIYRAHTTGGLVRDGDVSRRDAKRRADSAGKAATKKSKAA